MADDPNQTRDYEPGRVYFLHTGSKHTFRLPPDWMTVSFLLEDASGVESDFPKYQLKSSDGAYDVELSMKDDTKPGDRRLDLRFEKLLPGKRYTLTCQESDEISRVVFENKTYGEIVDQPRRFHEHLEAHGYGEFLFADSGGPMFEDWASDGEAEA